MNTVHTSRAEIVPYTTKDGSKIRELLHPQSHGNIEQSLGRGNGATGL